jgi:PAS domain S-box-containing protein
LHTRRANSERFEGRRIQLEGEIISKWNDVYGSYLGLRERRADVDTIQVFLISRHRPGIDFSTLDIGNRIMVTGILGQYTQPGKTEGGYEIFPRYAEDIKVLTPPTRAYWIALYIIFGALALVLIWVSVLRRQVAKQTRRLRESEDRFRSIFEGAKDAILVVRENMTIESANAAACVLTGLTKEEISSKILPDVFRSDRLPQIDSQSGIPGEMQAYEFETGVVGKENDDTSLLVKMNVFNSGSGRRYILVMRDITERKHAEKDREKLIDELTDALAEVRTLSGLLPICSSCKKIRDDKGYWKKLEVYFQSHSEVRFSHSLCPDCIQELYPDYAAKLKKPEDP